MALAVGIIGVGRMGEPILKHIRKAGYDVTYYDTNPEVRIRGAKRAETLADLTRASDVVLVIVGTDDQVQSCFEGRGGIFSVPVRGKAFVILSTVHPSTLDAVAKGAKGKGASILDAPVVWGEPGARKGELVSYVGGPKPAFEKCRPVLSAYSKGVFHLGPVGSGTVAKTANNHLMWVCRFASLEALSLASRYFTGDLDKLYEALLAGTCSNRCLERLNAGGDTPWAKKDLKIVQELAKASAARADFARIAARAAGDEDMLTFNREGLRWLKRKGGRKG